MAITYNVNTTYTSYMTNTHTCKKCGWRTYLKKDSAPPEICLKCKHDPVTGAELDLSKFFHNEHADEKVKLTTHVQVRWKCINCGHYGVKWVNAKSYHKNGVGCSNCEAQRVNASKIPQGGRAKSLWDHASAPIPAPKTNAIKCVECGNIQAFRHLRPRRCNNCGEEYPIDNAEVSV